MARAKPTLPKAPWDFGTGTAAQRDNLTEEEAVEADPVTGKKQNPNNARRKRRQPWIEVYQRKGVVTYEQYAAGLALLLAFEKTQRTAPAIKKVQVDSSPKPDEYVAIMVDRIGNYHNFARHVPVKYWVYVEHVVIDNRPIGSMAGCDGGVQQLKYIERLRAGLEELSRHIR